MTTPTLSGKTCITCHLVKPLDKFHIRNKKTWLYRTSCKECIYKKQKEYNQANYEKVHEMQTKYTKSHREQKNLYDRQRRPIFNAQRRERYKNNPIYKASVIARNRFGTLLRNINTTKTQSTEDVLGCSFEQFKLHLEKNFTPEMNWNNHGEVWHAEHVLPCNMYDLRDPSEQRLCFSYLNIIPLSRKDNLFKGATLRTILPVDVVDYH